MMLMSKTLKRAQGRKHKLARKLGFVFVLLFGLGNIVGAGIYALIGNVAGDAGYATPIVFVVAMGIAFLSGLSFAELASRYPLSEGASAYIHAAFKRKSLAIAVGILMLLATVVSAATLARAFGGYLTTIWDVPVALAAAVVLVVLSLVVMRGISESTALAVTVTVVEVVGLLAVIWFGATQPALQQINIKDYFIPTYGIAGAVTAVFLAFYAYIGIEDIVHLAEETKRPRANLPRAIVGSLLIATVLYIGVSIVALRTISLEQLASTNAPLTLVFGSITSLPPIIITCIALAAAAQGAMSHIISGSRLLYGMAEAGWLHRHLAYVHEGTKSPLIAIVAITLLAVVATVSFELTTLATATSFLILIVFGLINIGLIVIKRQKLVSAEFSVPSFVPVLGVLSIVALLVAQTINILQK